MTANHEPPSLSTARPAGASSPVSEVSASEAANQLRYRPGMAGGHVESHFLKGNSADGRRALWVKYTLLAPRGAPAPGSVGRGAHAVAELWAIAFDRSWPAPRANKRTYPV